MSWPKDAYYYLSGRRCKSHDKTVLLGVGRKGWRGGLLSLTYIGEITSHLLAKLELQNLVYGFEQGTGEMEVILAAANDIPKELLERMHGWVGGLEVEQPEGNDSVLLLIDASSLQEKEDHCAVYWLHFNFE